jgi:4-amino-4-deoxy-L-arabinose transferase-like glycosyltransferase
MYLPLILITLLSSAVCYWIAKKRSADRVYWVVLGLLLGPLAIPFACFAKPRVM